MGDTTHPLPAIVINPTLLSGLLPTLASNRIRVASFWASQRVGGKSPFLIHSESSRLCERGRVWR